MHFIWSWAIGGGKEVHWGCCVVGDASSTPRLWCFHMYRRIYLGTMLNLLGIIGVTLFPSVLLVNISLRSSSFICFSIFKVKVVSGLTMDD